MTNMTVEDYRQRLRQLSTMALVDELGRVRDALKTAGRTYKGLTSDWQARELLAELGERQLTLDGGASWLAKDVAAGPEVR